MSLLPERVVQPVEMGRVVEREPDIQSGREMMEVMGMEVTRAAAGAAQIKQARPVPVGLGEMEEAE